MSTPLSAGGPSGESELMYISKYLVQVILNTPKSSTSAAKQVSRTRVLTIADCTAMLDE